MYDTSQGKGNIPCLIYGQLLQTVIKKSLQIKMTELHSKLKRSQIPGEGKNCLSKLWKIFS